MYLISAYFDESTTKEIQKYINCVYEATGNGFMIDNNVPPHMTISALEARNADVLIPAFSELESCVKAGDIQVVSLGQFLPYVFYVTPVLNKYLKQLSLQTYNSFVGIPEVSVSKYYKPNSWLPHITLGKQLSKEQMCQAFYVMQDFKPIKGMIVRLGLSAVNPHRDVRTITLQRLINQEDNNEREYHKEK